jgi:hypothetical protein
MASLFQRTSSFDRQHGDPALPVHLHSTPPQVAKVGASDNGPTRSDLERWYKALNEIAQEPPFEHRSAVWSEIEDIRDEIYAYLR